MTIYPRTKTLIFQISAILILASAIVHSFDPEIAKYMIILGAIGFTGTTFTTPYPGKSLRGKRLFNMQVLAAILICVSAFLMYINRTFEWVALLLIASLLTLYAAIVLPHTYKQEQEEESKKKNK